MLLELFSKSFDRAADFMTDRTMMQFIGGLIALAFPIKGTESFLNNTAYTFLLVLIFAAVRHLLTITTMQTKITLLENKLRKQKTFKQMVKYK